MKEQQRNEIKVGMTVLIGILVLFAGFFVFKDWSIGRAEYPIRMSFPVSAGLDIGDQVSVNGVRAGKVVEVALVTDGVEVKAMMRSGVTVYDDGLPVIQMLELMGGKKIDIRQHGSGTPVDAGTVLHGRVDPDIAGALGLLGDMQGSVRDIATQADSLLRGVNAIVGDEEFTRSLKQTVANLHVLTDDLRSYMTRNSDNIDHLTRNMVTLTGRVDTMLADLQPAITGSLEKSDRVLRGADSLITEVRGLVGEIRDSRGLLHHAIHDTSLVGRLDRMLIRLDTLTSILIEGEFNTNIDLF
ncbi:MAG: MlaD family protein [Bacteroidota bacterium]|nr:MlaD family protein [Bacteroidota bacterium]